MDRLIAAVGMFSRAVLLTRSYIQLEQLDLVVQICFHCFTRGRTGALIRTFVLVPNIVQVQAARQPRVKAPIVHHVLLLVHSRCRLSVLHEWLYEHTSRLVGLKEHHLHFSEYSGYLRLAVGPSL